MNNTFIYALRDPRDYRIYYIGKSNDPERRFSQHIDELEYGTQNNKKLMWIKSLIDEGLEPVLEILENCLKDEWQEREKYWIAKELEDNSPLTNMSTGGCGLTEKIWVDWSPIMCMYLSPRLLDKFNNLEFAKQTEIAKQTAISMFDCGIEDRSFVGSETAVRLMQQSDYLRMSNDG